MLFLRLLTMQRFLLRLLLLQMTTLYCLMLQRLEFYLTTFLENAYNLIQELELA